MHNVLRKAQSNGVELASLRHETTKGLVISADKDVVNAEGAFYSNAYMLKLFVDGGAIYRSTSRPPTTADLDATLGLKFMIGPDRLKHMSPLKGSHIIKPTPNFDKAPEDKVADVRELRDLILRSNPAIRSINVGYEEMVVRKEYQDTNGREIIQSIPNSHVFVNAMGGTQSRVGSAFASAHTTLGYIFDFTDMQGLMDTINRRLSAQINGVPVKLSVLPTVIGPSAAGTFAHEAIGHLAEADGAEKALLYKLRGRKIADASVSIIDAPAVNTPLVNCNMKYDDEGTTSFPVRIVDNGVVKGFLTDLLYSRKLGLPVSGNLRAEDATVPGQIRMRNTYFERGAMKADELIRSIKDGYLITSASGGETNPADGTFQFGIDEGYKVKRGEVVASLRGGASMSGFTIEALASIDGIADDFQLDSGLCGKNGQNVPVSSGGPHLRLRSLKVG